MSRRVAELPGARLVMALWVTALAGCGREEGSADAGRESSVPATAEEVVTGDGASVAASTAEDSLLSSGVAFPVMASDLPGRLAFWGGGSPADLDAYPAPVPVARVTRVTAIPRLRADPGFAGPTEGANRAVRVTTAGVSRQRGLFGTEAPGGWTFLVVSTEWENIDPRERVRKDRRPDRTMGLGNFANASPPPSSSEMVEADVAYQVPAFVDHAYVVVGGRARALHPATEALEDGARLREEFTLPRLGDRRRVRFAYLVPEAATDIALRYLDYSYGQIELPLLGSPESAARADRTSRPLDRLEHQSLELAVDAFETLDSGSEPGRRTARVTLAGKSLSQVREGIRDIVQLPLMESVWLELDGGYVIAPAESSSDPLRFTPELFQEQTILFHIPERVDGASLGVRIANDVYHLELGLARPRGLPRPRSSLRDGDVLEVRYFGQRIDGEHLILDLGLVPVGEATGVDVQVAAQFRVRAGSEDLRIDRNATQALPHGRAYDFVLAPGTPIRFELAYRVPPGGAPTALRYRGFTLEGELEL